MAKNRKRKRRKAVDATLPRTLRKQNSAHQREVAAKTLRKTATKDGRTKHPLYDICRYAIRQTPWLPVSEAWRDSLTMCREIEADIGPRLGPNRILSVEEDELGWVRGNVFWELRLKNNRRMTWHRAQQRAYLRDLTALLDDGPTYDENGVAEVTSLSAPYLNCVCGSLGWQSSCACRVHQRYGLDHDHRDDDR